MKYISQHMKDYDTENFEIEIESKMSKLKITFDYKTLDASNWIIYFLVNILVYVHKKSSV